MAMRPPLRDAHGNLIRADGSSITDPPGDPLARFDALMAGKAIPIPKGIYLDVTNRLVDENGMHIRDPLGMSTPVDAEGTGWKPWPGATPRGGSSVHDMLLDSNQHARAARIAAREEMMENPDAGTW